MNRFSKTVPFLGVAFLFSLLFSACNLETITFHSTLHQTIYVDETTGAKNKAYADTIVLDATTDSDIQKYKSKIRSFKVNTIQYTIGNYDGPPNCIFNGSISFGDQDANTADFAANVTDLNVSETFANATVMSVEVTDEDVATINSLLKSDKAVKIYLNGTLSQTPVTFDINIKVDVGVEAETL